VLGLSATFAAAQSSDERATARDVVKKRGDAVVMVTATVKVRANIGGNEQNADQSAQGNATILDPSGLAVLSLSVLQPDEVMSRQISSRVRPDTKVEITSDVSDIKMHMIGGQEVAAKLVLRDADLDLAFIRPSQPPAAPMVAVDAAIGRPSILDPVFIIQRTSEATGWSTAAGFGSVQLVIEKPRTYYQVSIPTVGGSGLGAPIFDTAGKFVGIMLLRNTGSRGAGVPGVLPAEDVRDTAKQAK
jgi:trypsin-like peptidase